MRDVTDAEKSAWSSGGQKTLTLTFSDGTVLDNDDIYSEEMSLEQTMCDEDDIQFGKCSSACFKVRVFGSTKKYKGLTVVPVISVNDDDGNEYSWSMGTFTVEEEERSADLSYKDLTCYDAIYYFGNVDVAEWYNGLTFPSGGMTIKAFRDAFFKKVGITQAEIELPNDAVKINKTITAQTLSGLDVIESICELNACFGHIESDGTFKYVHLVGKDEALLPADDLYPSDTLYPKDYIDMTLGMSDYLQGEMEYEDYTVKQVTGVMFKSSDDSSEVGQLVGDDSNAYTIRGNFLISDADTDKLTTIGENFLDWTDFAEYNPCSVKTRCKPWMEVGDFLRIPTKTTVVYTPIMKRTVSGITALYDLYESKGEEYFGEDVNSLAIQIDELQKTTTTISKTTDSIALEVKDKVDSNKVIASINASTEGVTIDADNINLNGVVTANEYFKINTDGSMECKNGTFNGSINNGNGTFKVTTDGRLCSGYNSENKSYIFTVDNGVVKVDTSGRLDIGYLNDESSYATVRAIEFGTGARGGVYMNFSSMDLGFYPTHFSLSPVGDAGAYDYRTEIYNSVIFYGTVYNSQGSAVFTSDRAKKKDIAYLDEDKTSEFIYSLKPCEFRFTENESNRLHHGLIAQEVKESMGDDDWGLYVDVKPEEEGYKGLRYDELIADLIATVQKQHEEIEQLKADIKTLKGEE